MAQQRKVQWLRDGAGGMIINIQEKGRKKQCKSAEAWASTRTEELSELLMDIDDDDAPHVLLELIQRRSPGMQELYGDGCGTLHEP